MDHSTRFLPSSSIVVSAALAAALLATGCGSDSSQPPTSTAAAVAGPADLHCTMNGVEVKQDIGICIVPDGSTSSALSADDGGDALPGDAAADASLSDAGSKDGAATDGATSEAGGVDAGVAADGSADAGDDGGDNGGGDFGATLNNAEGDDDDCKYHVSWKSTAVKENTGVLFDVTVTRRIDGKAATGADVQIEAYLNASNPTPSVDIPNKESAGGNYRIGPVLFDKPGKWTVRFHFYEMCSDDPEDSPHGHAAFYLNVP